MVILGLDPGYDRLGWGILRKEAGRYNFIACGVIQTDKRTEHGVRLQQVYVELGKVIDAYQPQLAVVEKLYFARNVSTALPVAEARGVMLLALKQHGIEVRELTPSQIKLAVTGSGQADKKGIEKMVRLQLKNIPSKQLDDTLDALAAALSG